MVVPAVASVCTDPETPSQYETLKLEIPQTSKYLEAFNLEPACYTNETTVPYFSLPFVTVAASCLLERTTLTCRSVWKSSAMFSTLCCEHVKNGVTAY